MQVYSCRRSRYCSRYQRQEEIFSEQSARCCPSHCEVLIVDQLHPRARLVSSMMRRKAFTRRRSGNGFPQRSANHRYLSHRFGQVSPKPSRNDFARQQCPCLQRIYQRVHRTVRIRIARLGRPKRTEYFFAFGSSVRQNCRSNIACVCRFVCAQLNASTTPLGSFHGSTRNLDTTANRRESRSAPRRSSISRSLS